MQINDGYVNFITGAGSIHKDKMTAAGYVNTAPNAADAIAIYDQSWCGKRMVAVQIEDMLRQWRTFSGRASSKWQAIEKSHDYKSIVKKALTYASVTGGAAIYIHTYDKDLKKPLSSSSKFAQLEVFHKEEVISNFNVVLTNDFFNPKPEFVSILRTDINSNLKIHTSRFVFVDPPEVDFLHPSEMSNIFRGVSVYTPNVRLIHTIDNVINDIGHTSAEMGIDVVKIPDFASYFTTPEAEALLYKRMAAAHLGKSTYRAYIMDSNESHDTKTINMEPYTKLLRELLQAASASRGIPLTKFLGLSPGGLNSTGESDIRLYYDDIDARREGWLRKVLNALDEKVALVENVKTKEFTFDPLWQMPDDEAADIVNKRIDALIELRDLGIVTDEEFIRLSKDYLHKYMPIAEEDG